MSSTRKSAYVRLTPILLAAELAGLSVSRIDRIIAPDALAAFVNATGAAQGRGELEGHRLRIVDLRRARHRTDLRNTFMIVGVLRAGRLPEERVGLLTDSLAHDIEDAPHTHHFFANLATREVEGLSLASSG